MRFWTITMKTPSTITRKQNGQSLVELAMVFTLLLLLLTGVLDLGGMYYTYTSLQDTTQEGAIYASVHPTDLTAIQAHIKKSSTAPLDTSNLSAITVTCSGVECAASDIRSCQGQPITVTVVYTYYLTMPILPVVIDRSTVDLKTSVTETILQSTDTIAALHGLTPPQSCP